MYFQESSRLSTGRHSQRNLITPQPKTPGIQQDTSVNKLQDSEKFDLKGGEDVEFDDKHFDPQNIAQDSEIIKIEQMGSLIINKEQVGELKSPTKGGELTFVDTTPDDIEKIVLNQPKILVTPAIANFESQQRNVDLEKNDSLYDLSNSPSRIDFKKPITDFSKSQIGAADEIELSRDTMRVQCRKSQDFLQDTIKLELVPIKYNSGSNKDVSPQTENSQHIEMSEKDASQTIMHSPNNQLIQEQLTPMSR